MSAKILTESCSFTCELNRSLKISAKDAVNLKDYISHKKILTNTAICNVLTPLTCPLLTAQSGGTVPQPCRLNPAIPVIWKNVNKKIKINGRPVLTSDSTCTCIAGGRIIPVNYEKLVSIKNTSVNFSGFNNTDTKNSEAIQDKTNIADTNTVCDSQDTGNVYMENDVCSDNKDIISVIEENNLHSFASNCRCDYENCKERDTCEYFNTQIYVQNDSTALSNNFKSERTAEWNEYILKHNEKNIESTEGSWRIAAHHIISGNQVLLMKDSSGNVVYGDIVKLANYFKYNVNNSINCIMLPTNESNFGEKEPLGKIANAYEVMYLMGRQWHVGGHKYSLSKDTLNNLKDFYDKNPEQYPVPGNSAFFSNYQTAMKEEMDKLQAGIREQCWKKNYEHKREKFISKLNKVSKNVEEKLLAFKENPRKSFPFFVSKVAVEYAYNIPATSKIVVLYNDKSGISAKKYRVERYMKNELRIIFNEKGVMKISDDADFIRFCDNVMYFLIDSMISYNIPFKPDETDDFAVKNIEVNENDIDALLQRHCNEVMAFIQQNSKNFQPIAKIVSHRLNALSNVVSV